MHQHNYIYLAAMVCILSMNSTSGQHTEEYGIKGGLNLSNISGAGPYGSNTTSMTGFAVGFYGIFELGLPVMFQLDALYSQKGFKEEFVLIDETETELGYFEIEIENLFNYFELSPLIFYPASRHVGLFAGPTWGLLIDGKSILSFGNNIAELKIDSDDVNGPDFGLIVGVRYRLGFISIEGRYSQGLKRAIDKDFEGKNTVTQILLSYGY